MEADRPGAERATDKTSTGKWAIAIIRVDDRNPSIIKLRRPKGKPGRDQHVTSSNPGINRHVWG